MSSARAARDPYWPALIQQRRTVALLKGLELFASVVWHWLGDPALKKETSWSTASLSAMMDP